ncbi:MAG TPA: cytochrome C oxidase subunit I [Burkholderiales bacterium]|nr:cytochrome C oxidase subunit I [Burkholderiales bacterium]
MKPRTTLLLIALACAAPVVLATLAYYLDWAPGGTGNYGELIAPRSASVPPLDKLRGKWVLVTFDASQCDAYCEKKLYYMRQTRRAQGKEQGRIERLWLISDGGTPRPELLAAIEGSHVTPAPPGIGEYFPGTRADHIYLVDPLGNVMLRFPRDPDPKRIIKDLNRLLKYSRIG